MVRKYDHQYHFDSAIECEWCLKTIKRLPCICVQVDDVGDYAYFHYSCYTKQLKKDKGKSKG